MGIPLGTGGGGGAAPVGTKSQINQKKLLQTPLIGRLNRDSTSQSNPSHLWHMARESQRHTVSHHMGHQASVYAVFLGKQLSGRPLQLGLAVLVFHHAMPWI